MNSQPTEPVSVRLIVQAKRRFCISVCAFLSPVAFLFFFFSVFYIVFLTPHNRTRST